MQVKCNFKKEQWGILKKTLGILKLKAYHDLGTLQKKKNGKKGEFFPRGGPPPPSPLFGNDTFVGKKYGLFCISGP